MKLKLLEIKRAEGKRLKNWKDVIEIMTAESTADRECFWVLHLNSLNQVIEKELVGLGTLNAVFASPREIFKRAIINSAQSIICVHNHPEGSSEPSDADLKTFTRLIKASKLLRINLIDFIILGKDSYCSFFHLFQTRPIKNWLCPKVTGNFSSMHRKLSI